MAKFIFRLQSFLNLKEKMEEQKKQEYGRALAEVEHEKLVKINLVGEKDYQLRAFRNSVLTRIDAVTLKNFNNYIELLKRKIIHQDDVIKAAEARAEGKRVELVDAMKERKMLDTLREKAHEEYIREEQIADQKTVDEIVSYQYNDREE